MKYITGLQRKFVLAMAIAIIASASSSAWARSNPAYEWRMQQLFSPDAEQLYREQQGFVYIYAGLTEQEIAQALDQHFERIQSMMFVATVLTDSQGNIVRDKKTGNVVVDDDC